MADLTEQIVLDALRAQQRRVTVDAVFRVDADDVAWDPGSDAPIKGPAILRYILWSDWTVQVAIIGEPPG